jgi:hypothetical protein
MKINLTKKQKQTIELIKEHGTGIILFNQSSKVFVSKNGYPPKESIEIEFKMFEVLDFIGVLKYDNEINNDQYYYKLEEV